jgi:hypothetical protein
MQTPKSLKPIYVNDPNDPRLKAYNDKLKKYNYYKSKYENDPNVKKRNLKYDQMPYYKEGEAFYVSSDANPLYRMKKPQQVIYDKTKTDNMKKYAALKGAMNGGPGDEDKKKRKTILGGSSNSNYNPNEYEPVESDDLRKAREGQEKGEGIVVLRRHQHKEIEQAKKQGKTVYVPNERLKQKPPVEPVRAEREAPTLPIKRVSAITQQAREKIEVPEGPKYSQPNYTKRGTVVQVEKGKTRSYKGMGIKSVGGNKRVNQTKYYSLPKVEVYKGEKKKLIPSIVQKATGYDKKKMEGYENEEGTRIPGEIERAQNEDRQIKFTGASSIKDLIAQRKYNKQYPEWDKKTKSARLYNAMLANKE